jgi:hypothetical protein
MRLRLRRGLCLGFLNWSRSRSEASHRPGDAKALQDIASAHFIVSHDILPLDWTA